MSTERRTEEAAALWHAGGLKPAIYRPPDDPEYSYAEGVACGYADGWNAARTAIASRQAEAPVAPKARDMDDADMDAVQTAINRLGTGDIGYHAFCDAIIAIAAPKTDAPVAAEPVAWVELTDDDRSRAFQTLPDMLDGFLKKWGWLHFANAIEAICREKNGSPAPPQAPEPAQPAALTDAEIDAALEPQEPA